MIPRDKIYHFIAGLILCVIGCITLSPIGGIGLAVLGGIAKECYDKYDYGCFDVFDMLATWVGGCVGFMLINYWR